MSNGRDIIARGMAAYAAAHGGSGGGILVVTATVEDSTATLDKTWQEIYDAPYAVMVMEMGENEKVYYDIGDIYEDGGDYGVRVVTPGTPHDESLFLVTDSADGYPSLTMPSN